MVRLDLMPSAMTNERAITPSELKRSLRTLVDLPPKAGIREHSVMAYADDGSRFPLTFQVKEDLGTLRWVYEGPMIVGGDSVGQVQDAIGAARLDMAPLDGGWAHVTAFFQVV